MSVGTGLGGDNIIEGLCKDRDLRQNTLRLKDNGWTLLTLWDPMSLKYLGFGLSMKRVRSKNFLRDLIGTTVSC